MNLLVEMTYEVIAHGNHLSVADRKIGYAVGDRNITVLLTDVYIGDTALFGGLLAGDSPAVHIRKREVIGVQMLVEVLLDQGSLILGNDLGRSGQEDHDRGGKTNWNKGGKPSPGVREQLHTDLD